MTIEPVNSVMSLQAQTSVSPKEISPKTEPVTTEGQFPEIRPMADESTPAVAATSNDGETEQQNSDNQPSNEQIRQALKNLNKEMNNTEAQFGIHEATNRITIKIVDKDTKEVVKELPPEKTLDIIAKAWEIAGLLVDEKR